MKQRTVTFLLVSVLLATTTMAQVSFEWEQRASLPSAGRWGAYTFDIDGYGYVAGGHNGSGYRSDVWRYDPVNDQWEQRASMPAARRHGSAWSINGKGYLSCGQSSNSSFSNMLWEYDPILDQWTVKASLPGSGRYGTHGFALGDHGFVGGGNIGSANGPYLADMWRYDPILDQWSQVAGIPGQTRYGSTAFVIGAYGYVHGGRMGDLSFANELWRYDPVSGQWTPKPTMPGPGRSWSMVMPFDVDAVACCGAENGSSQYDAYRYVPGADLWTPIPAYPGASGWSGASFALQGRVFGGLGRVYEPVPGYHNDWWELVKVDVTSVEELGGSTKQNQLEIYPVPVSIGHPIQFFDRERALSQPGTLQIFDAQGRMILSEVYSNGSTISLQDIAPGLYMVMSRFDDQRTAVGRLVVE